MSTSTRPSASDWPPSEVRRTCLSEDAQRPSTSQRLFAAPTARTRTSTQLLRGVVADQDAISWVKSKPGAVGAEVQVPTA